jgi:hypothetical protein
VSARGCLAAATVLGACGMTLLHAQAGREPVGEPVRVVPGEAAYWLNRAKRLNTARTRDTSTPGSNGLST